MHDLKAFRTDMVSLARRTSDHCQVDGLPSRRVCHLAHRSTVCAMVSGFQRSYVKHYSCENVNGNFLLHVGWLSLEANARASVCVCA